MNTRQYRLCHGIVTGEIIIKGYDCKASGQKIIVSAKINDNHNGKTERTLPVGVDIGQQVCHDKQQNAVGGKAERLHDHQT